MEWIKSAVAGLVGIFIAFLIFAIYINIVGVAPFYVPPGHAGHKATFTIQAGVTTILFVYGIIWSLIFTLLFRDRASVLKGLGLGLVLWLFMMIVYGPYLGWGFFGFHGATVKEELQSLIHDSPWSYILITLLLHIVYGLIVGLLNAKWIDHEKLALPQSLQRSK